MVNTKYLVHARFSFLTMSWRAQFDGENLWTGGSSHIHLSHYLSLNVPSPAWQNFRKAQGCNIQILHQSKDQYDLSNADGVFLLIPQTLQQTFRLPSFWRTRTSSMDHHIARQQRASHWIAWPQEHAHQITFIFILYI